MALAHVTIKGVPLVRANGLSVHSSRSPSRSPSRSGFRSDEEIDRSLSRPRNGNGNHNHNHSYHPSPTHSAAFLAPPPILKVEEAETPYELGDTTTYKTSPDATRYFCTSCSAQLFWVHHVNGGDIWNVAVGVLERTEGVVRRTHHIWVGDTLDGGAADHLQVVAGLRLPRYKEGEGSEVLPVGWRADRLACAAENPTTKEQLKAFCHCGNVSFIITRPSEASFAPSAAYPDLLFPYNVSHMSKIINANDEKWWLRPKSSPHPTKYLAGHCTCNFCRHCSGVEIQSWAYIPLANVLRSDSMTPMCLEINEKRPSGLKQFIPSPGDYHEFCGTCGATVFSWKAGTSGLLNISVGLLDEENSGARAEDWLEWHRERVSFKENALSPSLAQALQEGLKATS